MRRKRTIYFNDARHFYLFVFEPPMRMEDMWRPVDEVAGTGVDTLVYGVARADGLFYPSKAGKSFRSDVDEIDNAIYWKVRHNILSLQERGVDILQALADRLSDIGPERSPVRAYRPQPPEREPEPHPEPQARPIDRILPRPTFRHPMWGKER